MFSSLILSLQVTLGPDFLCQKCTPYVRHRTWFSDQFKDKGHEVWQGGHRRALVNWRCGACCPGVARCEQIVVDSQGKCFPQSLRPRRAVGAGAARGHASLRVCVPNVSFYQWMVSLSLGHIVNECVFLYSRLQIRWHRISRLFLKLFQRSRILPMRFTIST